MLCSIFSTSALLESLSNTIFALPCGWTLWTTFRVARSTFETGCSSCTLCVARIVTLFIDRNDFWGWNYSWCILNNGACPLWLFKSTLYLIKKEQKHQLLTCRTSIRSSTLKIIEKFNLLLWKISHICIVYWLRIANQAIVAFIKCTTTI
jgi:hypothetical protein